MRAPLARKLAQFGLDTVGDLLEHYPRRYEDFTDRKAIADLQGGRGGDGAGDGRARHARAHGAVAASRSSRRSCATQSGAHGRRLVQPALAGQGARDGHGAQPARHRAQRSGGERVVRGEGPRDPRRRGRDRAHRGHRAGLPGQRGGLGPRAARPGASSCGGRRAACPTRCPARCAPPRACPRAPTPCWPCTRRARSPKRAVARDRLVLEELLLMQLGLLLHKRADAASHARAGAGRARRARCRFVGRPAVRAHRRSRSAAVAEIDADLSARDADAAPAAGRRRLGQDRRGRLHAAARGREAGTRPPSWRRPRRSPSSTSRRSSALLGRLVRRSSCSPRG